MHRRDEVTPLETAAAQETSAEASRFRWRVRDCVFCSWRELRELYSAAEMWQLLLQGRFTKAARVPTPKK
jgi:hypothetical protein